MGIEQTEIDALASLRPALLRELARDAVAPFYDDTLGRRVHEARRESIRTAQAAVDEQMDSERLGRLRADAARKLATMRQQIDELNESIQMDISDFDLETPVVPTAEIGADPHEEPLIDSDWSFSEQCRRLIDSKAYRTTEES